MKLSLKSSLVEHLMSSGGDDRITLDEVTGLNNYGCEPKPKNLISFSSSTASTISSGAYNFCKIKQHQLIERSIESSEYDSYTISVQEIKSFIKSYYSLDENVSIVLGPSGTDLEYIALALSLSKAKKITNIILGLEEVGSGMEYAAAGKYFSNKSALGKKVIQGQLLHGLDPEIITCKYLPIRNDDGHALTSNEILSNIEEVTIQSLKEGRRPLVHAIYRSKTGLITPGIDEIESLSKNYGDKIDIIVDACQGRISHLVINKYLQMGAMVMVTGSKFYCGAPFSGAILLPNNSIQNFRKVDLTSFSGLAPLFTREEIPQYWTSLYQSLNEEVNFGLVLRWYSAIYEMERLSNVDTEKIQFIIHSFRSLLVKQIHHSNDLLTLYHEDDENPNTSNKISHPLDENTIATVLINEIDRKGIEFNYEKAREVQKLLLANIKKLDKETKLLITTAQTVFHVGQPVKIRRTDDGNNWKANLRVSLGASKISELSLLENRSIELKIELELKMLFEKLEFILRYLRDEI